MSAKRILRRILRRLARPAALVRTTLVALGAGIAVNALFLQSGPHPAPRFATGEPAESMEPEEPDMLVIAAQQELKQAGYYSGAVDGLAGPETQAAIILFERAAGRPVTGAASPELLDAILSDPRSDSPSGKDAGSRAGIADRVTAVQAALSRAAYGPLPVDGVFGPQTRDAIRRFQADHGLPVTGEISDGLIVELRAAGALDAE